MKVSGFGREKWSFLKHVLTTKKSLLEICNSRKILTNEDPIYCSTTRHSPNTPVSRSP